MTDLTVQEPLESEIVGKNFWRRTPDERLRDNEFITSLLLRGRQTREIIDAIESKFGYRLTPQAITGDIRAIRDAWTNSALANMHTLKMQELAHITELERAAWDGWMRSLDNKVTETQEAIADNYGNKYDEAENERKRPATYTRNKATKVSIEQAGDPRFLEQIRWCIEQRLKLLGIDQPKKIQVDWRTEAKKMGVSDEEAEQVFQGIKTKVAKMLGDKYIRDGLEKHERADEDPLAGEFIEEIEE